jgi:hypothetical protein
MSADELEAAVKLPCEAALQSGTRTLPGFLQRLQLVHVQRGREPGGGPAWQDLKQPATTLTEVLIDPSGRQVVGTPINKLLSPATKP